MVKARRRDINGRWFLGIWFLVALSPVGTDQRCVVHGQETPAASPASDATGAEDSLVHDWRFWTPQERLQETEIQLADRYSAQQARLALDGLQQQPPVANHTEDAPPVMPLRWQLHRWVDVVTMAIPEVRQRYQELAYREQWLPTKNEATEPSEGQPESSVDWLDSQLRLQLGTEWAREQQYDLTVAVLANLSTEQVLFPEELLFYRGMAHYKLLQFSPARTDLELLLKHRERLPRRTTTLSELMLADIPEPEDGSLRQIARVMDDALRRQMLSESGKLVLDQEQRVVDLLDQLIQQKEDQQQQQQQQQSQSQSQQRSVKPMDQSMRAPLLGKGEIDPKKMSAKEWGKLPPEKQAEVIAEMTRQMPPHYKKVIEEYFRQLTEKKQ